MHTADRTHVFTFQTLQNYKQTDTLLVNNHIAVDRSFYNLPWQNKPTTMVNVWNVIFPIANCFTCPTEKVKNLNFMYFLHDVLNNICCCIRSCVAKMIPSSFFEIQSCITKEFDGVVDYQRILFWNVTKLDKNFY